MSDEKNTADLEAQATASSTTLPAPNNTHLETEKLETGSISSSNSADYDHDEVEAMDAGRQTDLGIDRVSFQSCCKSRLHANKNSRWFPVAW